MEWSLAAKGLALMALPKVGHKRRTVRLQEHRNLADTFASFFEESAERRLALEKQLPRCEALVTQAQDAGLEVLALDDLDYPQTLRSAGVPPPLVLFVQGDLPSQLLERDHARVASVAVVGTRSASQAGLDEAVELSRALAGAGVVVVSGLALGVDAAAHRGALSAKRSGHGAAPTVAVLGGAHDRLHPKENAGLAERIVEGGGAVLSEYPPGVPPNRGSFLARNRIIAWLSRAVVVVEAGARSGAISTAAYATDAGLPVLTVPARPSDRRRAGNLRLLRDGAVPLIDLSDLAGALSGNPALQDALRSRVERGNGPGSASGTPTGNGSSSTTKATGVTGGDVGSAGRRPAAGRVTPAAGLEREVMTTLYDSGEISFDGLLASLTRVGSPPLPTAAQLAGALVRLEVGGVVRRGEDGRFSAAGPLFTSDTVR